MSAIHLIRHGRPASTWGDADPDPGLDQTGRDQAMEAARVLASKPTSDRPIRVASSPLRRCQETAQPFARTLGVALDLDPAVAEIPTPAALSAADRPAWLRAAFAGRWSDIKGDIDYDAWRHAVVAAVAARPDTAVFSHFVAINAVLSVLLGDDRVIVFRPDHASITTLDLAGGRLSLRELGAEASTGVL